ncbi:MAG TPA: radical SAM protein, partial [Chromatiales bacterium]|nr:radical SAM protein [Chromatiales bacterium]
MSDWYEIARRVEPLEDVPLDRALVRDLQRAREARADRWSDTVHFYTPTFKSFQSSEISGCGKSAWPAVSTTAGECKLQCDHCKAKILETMIPARTPEALWRIVNEVIADGAR